MARYQYEHRTPRVGRSNPYDLQCLKIVDNPISYLIIVNPWESGVIVLQSEKIFS